MEKITGTPLLGFADVFSDGADMVGAGSGAGPLKSKAKPWKPSPITKAQAAKLHPVHVVPSAVKSAKKTVAAVRKAAAAIAAAKAKPAKVAILGAAPVHPTTKKPLTAKQQAAIAKYNGAAKKAQTTTAALHDAAAKAAHAAVALHAQIKKSKVAIHPAHLHGLGDTAIVGLDYLGDDSAPDPSLDTGDAGTDTAPADAPPAQAPPIETLISTVPPDGIVYDGTQGGFPRYSIGQASSFYGPNTNKAGAEPDSGGMYGYLWGWNHWNDPFKNKSEIAWIFRSGQAGIDPAQAVHAVFNPVAGIAQLIASGNDNWSDFPSVPPTDPSQLPDQSALISALDAAGAKYPDGTPISSATDPFVGGPSGPLKNLRWATKDKAWFWYLSEAPDAFTAASKYAAQQLAAAQAAADAAAAALQAKQDAQAQAQQAAAQAAADAASALADTQAQAAQTASDSATATAQAAADAAAIAQQQQAAEFNQQQDIEAARANQAAQAAQPPPAADDGETVDAEIVDDGNGDDSPAPEFGDEEGDQEAVE